MALPFFGFILGLLLFGLLAVVVLRVGSFAPVDFRTVSAFITAAFVGTLTYSFVYTRFFASSGELRSRAAVIVFLFGALVVATISGTVAARFASQAFTHSRSRV